MVDCGGFFMVYYVRIWGLVRGAARRANRPKDGFGGRRPTAPAKPGRPASRIPGACRGWWRRTGKEKLPGIAREGDWRG